MDDSSSDVIVEIQSTCSVPKKYFIDKSSPGREIHTANRQTDFLKNLFQTIP